MAHKKRIPEFQPPDNHILTEKTKLIKQLTDKQLNKTICLKKELARDNYFTKSKELVNITTIVQGEKNLDSYKEFIKLIENFEEFKSYGLTNDEIDFLNEYNKDGDISLKYKNLNKNALEQKLKYILDIIEKEKNKKIEQKPENNLVHPINNLQQISNELFQNTKIVVPSLKKRRKRIKKYLELPNNNGDCYNIASNKKTKWDVKEVCKNDTRFVSKISKQIKVENENETKEEKIIIGGKPFIGWKPNNNLNDGEKINIEEIKKINCFKNYEAGIPSKVLFIKNLAKNITEENLVNIFGHFDNEEKKITYRLLTGKMKGQAFITFNSVDQATNVLKTINGYIFKDKPIIIEYGKSK